ncbi:hypothetical protein JMUB7546_26980 [Staphylococcus aureus]
MSASLVGSEMCIRDRTNAAPFIAKLIEICLLYTSDAADD